MKKTKKHAGRGTIFALVCIVLLVGGGIIWRMGNTPLEDVYIPSKFSSGDLVQFEEELESIESQENYTGVVHWARMEDYLGYPGRAILVYEDWMLNNEPYRAIYNNIGKLYAKVCLVENKLNKDYCEKSVNYFELLIETYHDPIYYKDIAQVYEKMKKRDKAKESYRKYYHLTNGRERRFEEKIELSEEELMEPLEE